MGKRRIWLKQLATGTEVALTEGPDDDLPRFSPDGATVLLFATNGSAVRALPRLAARGRAAARDGRWARWVLVFGRCPHRVHAPISGLTREDRRHRDHGRGARRERGRGADSHSDRRDRAALVPRWLAHRVHANGCRRRIVLDSECDRRQWRRRDDGGLWRGSAAMGGEWSPTGRLVYAVGQVVAGKLAGTTGRLMELGTGRPPSLLYASPDSLGRFAIVDADRIVVESQTVRQNIVEWSGTPRPQHLAGAASGSAADLFTGRPMDRVHVGPFRKSRSVDGLDEHRRITPGDRRRRGRLGPGIRSGWPAVLELEPRRHASRSGRPRATAAARIKLTHDGVDAENPSVSPDGKWMVYGSTRPERGWNLAGADRTDRIRSCWRAGLYGIPHISPDGQHVLYMGFSSILVSTGVKVVRLVGRCAGRFRDRRRRRSAPRPPTSDAPAGCRTATRSRFSARTRRASNGIYVQDFVPGRDTASTRRPLGGIRCVVDAETFAVSPDGKRVAVVGPRDGVEPGAARAARSYARAIRRRGAGLQPC